MLCAKMNALYKESTGYRQASVESGGGREHDGDRRHGECIRTNWGRR